MGNSEICAICGGVYGLHNHMNKACPKDINADRNHTEYRRTVFTTQPPSTVSGEGEVTAEFFLPPDEGEGWQQGAETFTRQEVFNLLYTQRAMISNDLKANCYLTEDVLQIITYPRIPKF